MLKKVLEESKRAARLRRPSGKDDDTRIRILDAAEELLQCRGFNAFSYQHIAKRLGIRNAAIHYHYPGKADLGVALVRRYRERFQEWVADAEARIEDPWELLQAYFGVCLDYLNTGNRVCPGGVLGTEFQSLPQQMCEETRLLMAEIYEWLIDVLRRGYDDGRLSFQGSPEGKAIIIGTALQGALQVARVTNNDRFTEVIRQIEAELRPAA